MSITEIIISTIIGKFIIDNLPKFSYKKLSKGFKRYVLPCLLIASLYLSYLFVKWKGDKELEKNYLITLYAVIIVFLAYKTIMQKIKAHKQLVEKVGYE